MELGLEEMDGPGSIVLIEWPERAGTLLPEPRWEMRLAFASDDERDLEAVPVSGPPALPDGGDKGKGKGKGKGVGAGTGS